MADYASGRGYGVLLNSLFRGVMSGKDERFLVATESGIVRVFAPESVRREVEEKLQPGSSWCRKRHLDDVAIFRDRWVRRYLPVVRFVAIQARDVADPRVSAVAQRDPTDGAFAALVSLLARSLASCGSY